MPAAETLFEKPAFRASAKRRRCLIFADGYYEWQATVAKTKQPYYFRMADNKAFAFAGIWDNWNGEGELIESCSIITTRRRTNAPAAIHDRMPVILRGDDADAWIDPDVEEPKALVTLLRPFPAALMICYAVGSAVGNVRNNSSACIEALANGSDH